MWQGFDELRWRVRLVSAEMGCNAVVDGQSAMMIVRTCSMECDRPIYFDEMGDDILLDERKDSVIRIASIYRLYIVELSPSYSS
ncbi:hypothetical protein CASFOL_041142 [Castilleja foliolosa]|uniref:Uncharacterized protein n=1 Tax=Castilleja foliolosa TaxID=1961234 RepID=A0ABD3BEJ8_9LAMI